MPELDDSMSFRIRNPNRLVMRPLKILEKRVRCLFAKLTGENAVRHVGYCDVLLRLFSVEGLRKRWLLAKAIVQEGDRFNRVTIGSVSVCWPKGTSLQPLVDVYNETFVSHNHHQFERFGTVVGAGEVVLDCGACEGYFAKRVLDRCGRIYLVEPSPMMRRCLAETFREEIQSEQVQIVGVLLGKADGEVAFLDNTDNPTLSRLLPDGETDEGACIIPRKRIDTLVTELGIERVDFIKADVEGGELDLIQGAEQTIRRWCPKIAITTYHNPDHADRLIELITGLESSYRFRIKGIMASGTSVRPVMAHFWVE